MKKIVLKALIIFLLVLFMFSSFYSIMATSITDNFKNDKTTLEADDQGAAKITEIISIILVIVRNVGAGLAVLILIVIGCKYILASAGERADIKKYAVTYVIGAIVLFASSGIAEMLKDFALSATADKNSGH